VEDSFPITQILLAEGRVEAVGVSRGGDIGCGRAFAQHLLNGVSGDEVDQEKDETHYQPDYWEGVENALEEDFQSVSQLPVVPVAAMSD
jgi:hypothetical protein